MLREVVAAHEFSLTNTAFILFLASVRATMTRQLIGACEAPVAAVLVAGEGFLTCASQIVNRIVYKSFNLDTVYLTNLFNVRSYKSTRFKTVEVTYLCEFAGEP